MKVSQARLDFARDVLAGARVNRANLRKFILEAMGVSFDFASILERPDGLGEWSKDSSHWRVTIKRGNEVMTTHYSQGSAFEARTPGDTDVFGSLLMDTSDIEGSDFEEWAENLGFDTDSRKAEKMFQACQKTLTELTTMFSPSELDGLREIFSDL